MPAFDSTSNFNASWSNSFATVVLAPGTAVAAGFARAAGRRYFEFAIVSNTAVGNLYLGLLFRGGASQLMWLLGSDDEGNWLIANPNGELSSRLPTTGSMTWATGDVVGFAVNYSMDGVGGVSSLTFSNGSGSGYAVVEVTRNGSLVNRAIFEQTGAMLGARPLVAQRTPDDFRLDLAVSTSAVVTLRISSLSYSYCPTAYNEWEPSNGLVQPSLSATIVDWGWLVGGGSPGSGDISLTNSNHLITLAAGQTLSSSTVQMGWRSEVLPMTHQKTCFEVYSPYTLSFDTVFSRFHFARDTAAASTEWYSHSITRTDIWSFAGLYAASPSMTKPGGDTTALDFALANTGNLGPNQVKGIQVFYDVTRGFNVFGELTFGGTASLTSFDIISSPQHVTVTSSQTMFIGLTVISIGDFVAATQQDVWLNPGSVRGFDWPMFPGWRSVDNSRIVIGGGCAWVANNHATVQYEIRVNLNTTALVGNGSGVRADLAHSTGKRYFEIRYHNSWPSLYLGVATTVTASAANVGTIVANGIFLQQETFANKQNVVYGTTTSASTTISYPFTTLAERFCCAVDFDVGRVWFAFGNVNERTWQNGGDPAAGVGGITFTAGTAFFPALVIEKPNNFLGYAAFESAAMRFDPPTGFSQWSSTTITATATSTVTPSVTGTVSGSGTVGGGSGSVKWPFGVRP